MKKIGFIALLIFLAAVLCGGYFYSRQAAVKTFYLNAYDDVSYKQMEKLATALKQEGIKSVISDKSHFQSGKFNIYAAQDDKALPAVIDSRAINFLWVPKVQQNTPEPLRPFDVIVVQSMPSYSHLKAINVRTAYIPKAFDVTAENNVTAEAKLMFYGNNDKGFSLSLFLAGPTDLKIDVFGKGFEGYWGDDEIMKRPVESEDFRRYALALADQSEEDIRDEVINEQIITIIENGGVPYIRYNQGVYKIFGDDIPMYYHENEFLEKLKYLLAHPNEVVQYRHAIKRIAEKWNSTAQAQKFIELFEVMEKKMLLAQNNK